MALESIHEPADLRTLSYPELDELAGEIRDFVVQAVAETGGHLGSNLGAVELTLALHRVFDSPRDAVLWDTGHQAYIHKILTGRQGRFDQLRQANGLSGYPSREESQHDFIENSHASTVLSYAYGLAAARDAGTSGDRRHVVAVIGDGSMTGGMAYEALNNLGHSQRRVIVVLNDNGRSYAPTISNLSAPATALLGDSITITWRAADPSGVKYSIVWFANGGFASSNGVSVVDYGDYGVTRLSGDEFDGVYSQTVRFRDDSPTGTYTLWVSRADLPGNKVFDDTPVRITVSG